MPAVSVIIPVYRDDAALERTLEATDLTGCEVIVAATPDDRESLAPLRSRRPDIVWVESNRGRARQMNAGASVARGDWLVFLHADTQLPSGWSDALAAAGREAPGAWGCFRFALDSPAVMARVIEMAVRLRVRLLTLPYGDQAIFVRRTLFNEIGGYADLPLLEDVELVRRLRRHGRPLCSALAAVTSARRWEQDGWIRRSATNVLTVSAYFCGVTAERLWRLYNGKYAD